MAPRDGFLDLTGDLDFSMLVVTAFDGRERAGCLLGFSTQCSIDPPRYLVCISATNHTAKVVAGSEMLAVHALDAGQTDLARLFGEETGDEIDKFTRVGWRPGPGDVPVLEACTSWFAGRVVERIPVGDHTAVVLDPVEVSHAPGLRPLRFADVKDMTPGHLP